MRAILDFALEMSQSSSCNKINCKKKGVGGKKQKNSNQKSVSLSESIIIIKLVKCYFRFSFQIQHTEIPILDHISQR